MSLDGDMSGEEKVYRSVSELESLFGAIRDGVENRADGKLPGIVGFDGFIDTFIELESTDRMEHFGPKVADAAGIATSFTAKHKGDRFGGNGPLFASALNEFFAGDAGVAYFGALGDPDPLPLFQEALEDRTRRLVTLADPAHSDCLEFKDGKVMLSDLRTCADIHWERLTERIAASKTGTTKAVRRSSRTIASIQCGGSKTIGPIMPCFPGAAPANCSIEWRSTAPSANTSKTW